jgi:hypothetical protein
MLFMQATNRPQPEAGSTGSRRDLLAGPRIGFVASATSLLVLVLLLLLPAWVAGQELVTRDPNKVTKVSHELVENGTVRQSR